MSFRTVLLISASIVIGIACTATVSTEVSADIPAGATRHYHHQHQGTVRQVRHFQNPAMLPAIVGVGRPASPYCWPYDFTYDPYEYCGASYIVSW